MRYMALSYLLRTYKDGDEVGWENEFKYLEEIHSHKLDFLINSISLHGIASPIQLGYDKRVWDGHHRLYAAKHLGIRWVPVEKIKKPKETQ